METEYQENSRSHVAAWIFCLFGAFLALSLISYNESDPSMNRAAGAAVKNIFSYPGAYIADPILQFIGLSSALPIAALFIWGARCSLQQKPSHLWGRSVALILATFGVCGLLAMIQINESWPFYVSYGGLFGDMFYESYVPITMEQEWFIALTSAIVLLFSFPALAMRWSEIAWFGKSLYNASIYSI